MDELREKIVAVAEAHFNNPETWNYQQLADAILAIPEIRDALHVMRGLDLDEAVVEAILSLKV